MHQVLNFMCFARKLRLHPVFYAEKLTGNNPEIYSVWEVENMLIFTNKVSII